MGTLGSLFLGTLLTLTVLTPQGCWQDSRYHQDGSFYARQSRPYYSAKSPTIHNQIREDDEEDEPAKKSRMSPKEGQVAEYKACLLGDHHP